VRIAAFVALLSFFISAFMGQVLFAPVIWLVSPIAAGFLAVYLYRKRTGQPITVRAGVRIGGLTGIFAFLIGMVLVTLMMVAIRDTEFTNTLIEQMRARGAEVSVQNIQMFRSPAGIAQTLISLCIICGLFPTLGGALGAAFFSKR
jgi:hypothetical protein